MTQTPSDEQLLAAERALHAAQLAGDVGALDHLLDDRLVAIGPDGSRYTKNDDVTAYSSGSSVITDLVEESVEVIVAGTTGVTFFTGTVAGTFGGQPMSPPAAVHQDVGARRRGWLANPRCPHLPVVAARLIPTSPGSGRRHLAATKVG